MHFHPQGSNIYKATDGTKLIKFQIAGQDWLDPSTFRIMYDLRNDAAIAGQQLRPVGGPWSFFSRMRILAGGQILEDIDMYNRVHEMFSIFGSSESRISDYSEGFNNYWEDKAASTEINPTLLKGIFQGESQTVLFRPLSGILRQRKYIPLRYIQLTIELSLVDNNIDPLVAFDGTISMLTTFLLHGLF